MKKSFTLLLVLLMCMAPFCALAYENLEIYEYTDSETEIVVKYTMNYTFFEDNIYWFFKDFSVAAREGQCPAGSMTVYGQRNGMLFGAIEVTYKLEEYDGAAVDSDCTQAYSQTYKYKVYYNEVSGNWRYYQLVREAESAHNWSDWTVSVTEDGETQYTRECIHPVCAVSETYLLDEWTSNGDSTHSRIVLVDDAPVLETADCAGGTATCTHLAICDECGGEHGEVDPENHSYTTVYTSNGDGTHSLVCDHDAAHVSTDTVTCTEFDEVDNKDLATHSLVCVTCGYVSNASVQHWAKSDDGNCLTPVLCRYCDGVVVAAREAHEYEEGVCLYCDVREKYAITYMDGETTLDTEEIEAGIGYYLMVLDDKDDLVFVGWDEDGDGEADYVVGESIYGKGPMTLYAVYKQMYTITYYEYDGEQDAYYDGYPVEVVAGEEVKVSEQYSYYYKFVGWATEAKGKVVYPAGTQITPTGNMSLYSIVEPFSATIDLDAEDASYEDSDGNAITTLQGEMPYSVLMITDFPVRPGYIFKGFVDDVYYSEWSITTDEETSASYIEIYLSEDLTLTAIWEECTEHSFNSKGECACGYACKHNCANGATCTLCSAVVSRKQLSLPAQLTTVESEAFLGTAAEAILVPSGVTTIGEKAFANSTSLRAVIFVSANATIASDALSGSANAVIVAPAGGTVEAWATANSVTFIELQD